MARRWTVRPEGSNWGDFGDDDELGRVNLIAAEQARSDRDRECPGSRIHRSRRAAYLSRPPGGGRGHAVCGDDVGREFSVERWRRRFVGHLGSPCPSRTMRGRHTSPTRWVPHARADFLLGQRRHGPPVTNTIRAGSKRQPTASDRGFGFRFFRRRVGCQCSAFIG